MAQVRLVDLEIIKRFSLAIRSEYAEAEDLLHALDASRAEVERALGQRPTGRSTTNTRRAPSRAAGQSSSAQPAPPKPPAKAKPRPRAKPATSGKRTAKSTPTRGGGRPRSAKSGR
jgi:hypothetical protein